MKAAMKTSALPFPAVAALLLIGCAPSPSPVDAAREQTEIGRVINDFHDAAAHADEARYFGHLTREAVFLGTDATERWDREAFRVYAHPYFARGKAWSFRSVRRAIWIDPGGKVAWFDEELATEKLGPARGSGVLVREAGGATWAIAQYNLNITIPNARFPEVRRLLAGEAPAPPATP